MKVLFISHYSGLGGANRSMLDLIDAYKEIGIKVIVVLPNQGPVLAELSKRNITMLIIKYFNWVRYPNETRINDKLKFLIKDIINIKAIKKISTFAKREHVDLIHTNDSLTVVGILVAQMTRIKHIWHLREFLLEDYGLEFRYTNDRVNHLLNSSQRVIAISNQIYNRYVQRVDAKKLVLVYNGVKLPNKISKKKNKVFSIAFAGGSNEKKGTWDVLEAAKWLKNEKDAIFNIIIAGEFQNKEMNNFIKDNNLGNCITIIGRVCNWEEIRCLCHVYLVCSLKEAFGRVTIEAMLDRLPVIGTNSGATPELINDGIDGLLYEFGNYKSLAQMIYYLMKNPEDATKIALAGFDKASKLYQIKNTADKLNSIYMSVLCGN